MEETTPAGKKFAEALAKWGGKQVDLAKALGVKPQRIQHWKKRGVSAKLAKRVGRLIGAPAYAEISSVEDDGPVPEPGGKAESVSDIFATYSTPSDIELAIEVEGLSDNDILSVLINHKDSLTPGGKAKLISVLASSLAADLSAQPK